MGKAFKLSAECGGWFVTRLERKQGAPFFVLQACRSDI